MTTTPPATWTSADDTPHPDSTQEWWATEALLTDTAGTPWSLRTYIWHTTDDHHSPETYLIITLLNQTTGHHTTYTAREPHQKNTTTESLHIHCQDSHITGLYPTYTLTLHDPDHHIHLTLTLHATTNPHWVANTATKGWLPIGFGTFRYGFIPKLTATGTLTIPHTPPRPITGTAYYEHIWGTFSYTTLLPPTLKLRKTLTIYTKLTAWWLHHHTPHLPHTLMLATENNPIGNDWAWATLDNGWTIFYGNTLLWIMDGPAIGILILTKDNHTNTEFTNLTFHYTHTKHNTTYDFYYPTTLTITARNHHETLHLQFTNNPHHQELLDVFSQDHHWTSLVVCENPSTVTGTYTTPTTTIPLTGKGKIELQRQLSKHGHTSLRLHLTLPPHGIGLTTDFRSHHLHKHLTTTIHLLPKPRLHFTAHTITPTNIPGEKNL